MTHGVTPVQLRLRRDVPAIDAAISASAVLHRKQRETDDKGRIVATLDDYHNAYSAFEPGMAALYDAKPDAALETTLAKIVEIVLEEAESIDRDKLHVVSHKIDAEQLRRRLGVSAIRTAYDRINRLSAIGAIEEDNAKRGKGRGSPRFYFIKKTSVAGLTGGVYPTVENVKSHLLPTVPAALDAQEGKLEETLGSSSAVTGISEIALDAQDNPKGRCGAKGSETSSASSAISENSDAAPDSPTISSGFASSASSAAGIVGRQTAFHARKRGNGSGVSGLTAKERIDAARGAGAVIKLNDAGGFDLGLDQVEPDLRQMLVDEIAEDEDAVVAALEAEVVAVAPATETPKNAQGPAAGAPPTGNGLKAPDQPLTLEPVDLGAAAESTGYYRTIAGAFMRSPGGEPDGGGRR
jgi:hypothetical protein